MTKTSQDPPTTRERILSAAADLFLERGYARTSIATIERAAGLAPRTGGFYRHFESKEALLIAISRGIIERPSEMGFGHLLPLGDTRAELLLIAKGYRRAAERQAPLAALIGEVRHLPAIQELVAEVEDELRDSFRDWIADKPALRGRDTADRVAMIFMIFGGWLSYLEKRQAPWVPHELDDEAMMDRWASHWARVLDSEAPPF